MNTKLKFQNVITHSDFWVGLSIFIIGFIAALMANEFDQLSKPYPLTLSSLLTLFGGLLAVKPLFFAGETVSFKEPARIAIIAIVFLSIWIAAISIGLGYILPTLFMEMTFMWLCGVQGWKRIFSFSALITVLSYFIFIYALKVKIPEPILVVLL